MISMESIFNIDSNIKFIKSDIYNKQILDDINTMIDNKLSKTDWYYIGNIHKADFTKPRFVYIIVAYNKNECVGFASFNKIKYLEDKDDTDVSKYVNIDLAVSEDCRGKHIPAKMISEAIPYLKKEKYKTILWVAWNKNKNSIKSAESNGFKKLKKLHDGGSICYTKSI